jgi:hypothetical protein
LANFAFSDWMTVSFSVLFITCHLLPNVGSRWGPRGCASPTSERGRRTLAKEKNKAGAAFSSEDVGGKA